VAAGDRGDGGAAGYVILAGVITLAASWLVWTMAGLNERLDEISTQLSARLFRNTALVISLLIIALGVGRIFDVTYVTTVLDSASGWQILLYLVFGYAIAFWSDYWIDRISGEEMLKVVGHNESHSIQLDYKIDLEKDQRTDVHVEGRVLRLHGIGRFLVVREKAVELTDASGWTPMWVKSRCPAFHSWTYADFFERLQACADSQGRARPLARQIQARLLQFQSLNALVFAILLGSGIWLLSKETQVPLAEATVQQPPELTLATLLTKSEDPGKPPIFIAASGGGTRAALFTAAVLEGIWKGQGGKQLVLGSGVSGGGAALAYYGSNRKELVAGKDWDLYFKRISEPFIRDVLDRASEWRMMTGDRLGTLLQESFRRRWELNSNRQTLGQIEDFGLIFNTTLAGHYRDDGKGQGSLAERASEHMREHRSSLAGGRLILTNLNMRDAFKDSNLPYRQQILLPVVVDSPQMELVKAAALNANFPPVFSNAPVDVDGRTRYWVTDGGAADNRGVEMLMYAVRQMLAANPKALPKGALIVVADAGAESDSFSQDRGIGSATGAGSVFAMHLSAEILRDINRIEPNVKLIYVRMPKILRASGSFGTHWMLQPNIRVNDPNPTDKSLSTISKIKEWWAGKSIEGPEAIVMLRALYGGQPENGLGTTGQEVLGWLKESEEYRGDWKAVQEWLAAQH